MKAQQMQKQKGASKAQLQRLNAVKDKEWMAAQAALLPTIARLLHGRVTTNDDGQTELVGGYTKYGAHSESELGGNALYHYWGMMVERLYDGTCEWSPELSLEEQLKEMAKPVIDQTMKKYRSRKNWEERQGIDTTPVDIDMEWLGEDESLATTSTDSQHMKWEAICDAADGDTELERFVQVTGECQTIKEVNERLSLKSGNRDKLMKRLKRRVRFEM